MLTRTNWFCTNILIVRHGQSDNNTTYDLVHTMFGDTLSPEQYEIELNKLHNPDCGMSETGHKQAKHLGEFIAAGKLNLLKHAKTWKIISSPMTRCLLTSQYVANAFGDRKKVTVHPRFYESDGCYKKAEDGSSVGLPGMTKAEVEATFPNFECLPGMEEGWYAGYNAKETSGEFKNRCGELVEILWKMHSDRLTTAVAMELTSSIKDTDEGILLVAHGNLIRGVVSKLLGTEGMITSDNTGITHIQLWSDRTNEHRLASLLSVNRVDHLLDAENGALITGGAIFEDHWIQEYLDA